MTGPVTGPGNIDDAAMTATLLADLVETHDGDGGDAEDGQEPAVYGAMPPISGENLELLERLAATPMVKTQPAVAAGGRFTKDDFDVDLAD
jgi:hypothetical protein